MAKHSRTLAAYLFIAGLMSVLAYPALVWLVNSWIGNPYYTHGFLIPPLTALLLWRQARYVVAEPRRGNTLPGVLLMLPSLGIVVWAMRWHNYAFSLLALIVLIIGILLFLEGWGRLRYWLFPILFLGLAVPMPFIDLASPWLESFTAKWATQIARIGGINAVQQGGEILLPNTTVVVGAPCSGLRSLVTMITVAVGWIYLVEGRWWAKAIMLVAVVPLVTFANVLRVGILLVVAQFWGEEAALSYYHDWSSPILFMMALALLLVLGKLLKCSQIREDIF